MPASPHPSPGRPTALALLALSACAVVDPDAAPPLVPTLILACEHPDAWFEGVYPGPGAEPRAYPAAVPHRPGRLRTELARADFDGPRGTAAQTACADVCVGLAEPGFYYRCPDRGWHIEAARTLAPPRVPDLPGPDTCYPDSACAAAFAAPVGHHLRAPTGPAEPGRRQADHLGLAEADLDLTLPGARVHHPMHALAEYSAGTCSSDPCFFYLANLQLDDRGAASRTTLASGPASLHDLRVELMQPALAHFTRDTGAVHFPAGALDLRIRLGLAAGPLTSGEHELRMRNPTDLHGRFLAGALELAVELPLAPRTSARLALEFRPRAHPPEATFDPPLQLPAGPDGLLLPHDPTLPSPLHAAHDPDGDLRSLHWVVDGEPGARHIPPGEHEVELWATDSRGALDRSPTRTIEITSL